MTEQKLANRLLPGEFSYDNSAHRYKGKVGFEWEAINMQGKCFSGVARTQDEAILIAELKAR